MKLKKPKLFKKIDKALGKKGASTALIIGAVAGYTIHPVVGAAYVGDALINGKDA